MNRLTQEAIIVGLVRRLRERGSRSGETHVQKATYMQHELWSVPFDFDFSLQVGEMLVIPRLCFGNCRDI